MPHIPRPRTAPAEEWQQLQLLIHWPEQLVYELIRPVVLFGASAAERTRQTKAPEHSLRRKADRFDRQGMASLFADFAAPKPTPLRQLIVDLRTEYPAFRLGDIAQICFVTFGRLPSPHTIQKILATGPKPTSVSRRYPRYHQFTDPAERRLAIILLHAEGWRVACIAGYLRTSRQTVYLTLRRWILRVLRALRTNHLCRSTRGAPSI
jgi:hypothetical protein